MSLFKTEEYWSTKCGFGENFIASTLCALNFLTKSNKSDQIICGSLGGFLRMYSQISKVDETVMSSDGDTNPFSLNNNRSEMDLCMEYNIKYPILQIAVGRFIADKNISIAVLTPQKLILLIVDEDSMSFRAMEEFSLQRTSFNFCYGGFGRSTDRDYICVQSTDGTLTFYVNGHLSFVSYLANSLLPGPIAYIHQDDAVLLASGGLRVLEGYRYKSLAVSQQSGNSSASQKRSLPDWTVNIGEAAIDMCVCDSPKDGAIVVVLARHSLFVINNNSGVVLNKKFETRLLSLVSYGEVDDNGPRLIIVNNGGELMVLRGTKLLWKAAMAHIDLVAVCLGRFNVMANFIVTISENGQLSIVYLGTDPALGSITLPCSREIISGDNEDELGRLQQKIKTITTTGAPSTVHVQLKESRSCVKVVVDHSTARLVPQENASPEYIVDIKLRSSSDVTNVLLRVAVRQPLIVSERQMYLASLTANKEVACRFKLRSSGAMVVCTLKVAAYVTYETVDRCLRTCQTSFSLPLNLVAETCVPCKQAKFKVTIDTKEDSVSLKKLFPEMPGHGDQEHHDVALAVQYYNGGPIITILASATSRRYRIQSDHFEALWLLLKELKNRLGQHFGSNFRPVYSEALPLDSYFLVLDFHFSIRQNLNQFNELLEQRSKQYRAIEKLLLSKTKDKTQTSLQNLDTLLENSISQLMQLSELVEEQQQHLVIVGNALCSATSIIGFLLQLTSSMSPSQQEMVGKALSGHCYDFPELGLEELYGQIYVHLLRNVFSSKSAKETQMTLTTLELPDSVDKLKKHIKILCDRVCKGVPVREDNRGSKVEESVDGAFSEDMKFVHSPRVANKPKKSRRKQNRAEEEA